MPLFSSSLDGLLIIRKLPPNAIDFLAGFHEVLGMLAGNPPKVYGVCFPFSHLFLPALF